MTTYTTPHFATGTSDRNVRPEASLNRARPASAATYRTAGVTNEAALMSDGRTPDWQPGVSKGVPKAAIGAMGAALVGGVALAIVLLSPSNKVTKQVMPDPIAQATAQNAASQKSVDSTDAAVAGLNNDPPAAGSTAATDAAAAAATQQAATPAATPAPAVPAPVQAVTPDAPPVVNAPVARVRHAPTPRVVAPQPAQPVPVQAAPQPAQPTPAQAAPVQPAPVVTPDSPAPSVTPAAVQPPAMQQTPDVPTVTPAPAPAPTPDTPAPTPAPAPNE